MSGQCSLTRILPSLGRGFLALTPLSTLTASTLIPPLGTMQRNALWRMRRDLNRTRLKPCSPWVIINTGGNAITGCQNHLRSRQQNVTWQQRGTICPRLSYPTRGTLGSKHCLLRASPHSGPTQCEVTDATRQNYGILRQFPAALKLYERALDITPNDRDVMAAKASIYLAQGNLQEAAKLLSEVNGQIPNQQAF